MDGICIREWHAALRSTGIEHLPHATQIGLSLRSIRLDSSYADPLKSEKVTANFHVMIIRRSILQV